MILAAATAVFWERAEAADCGDLRVSYSGPAGKTTCTVDHNTGDADARATYETIIVERPGTVLFIAFVQAGMRTYINRAELRSSLEKVKELGRMTDWTTAPQGYGFNAQRFSADFNTGTRSACFGFFKQEGVPIGAPGLGVAKQLLGFYCAPGRTDIADDEIDGILAAIHY
jgi:hypothetical protein